jgi:hypothetical protein
VINYVARSDHKPRYYANDHTRDTLTIDPRIMPIHDARALSTSLDIEGFILVSHQSAVTDFGDRLASAAVYALEIETLVSSLTGADLVQVSSPGILRFSEKSAQAGALNNSMPARFVHVDITDETAALFVAQSRPSDKAIRRHAHFNVWRAISNPPQDVPLAVCDARTVRSDDLIVADAVFDEAGQPEWSFEGWVVAYNAAHRWHWFRDMTPDEALIFKTNDTDTSCARCVPHVAFDDATCPTDAAPRASIEMRATAYWYA